MWLHTILLRKSICDLDGGAERTGCFVRHNLWSYVLILFLVMVDNGAHIVVRLSIGSMPSIHSLPAGRRSDTGRQRLMALATRRTETHM